MLIDKKYPMSDRSVCKQMTWPLTYDDGINLRGKRCDEEAFFLWQSQRKQNWISNFFFNNEFSGLTIRLIDFNFGVSKTQLQNKITFCLVQKEQGPFLKSSMQSKFTVFFFVSSEKSLLF